MINLFKNMTIGSKAVSQVVDLKISVSYSDTDIFFCMIIKN